MIRTTLGPPLRAARAVASPAARVLAIRNAALALSNNEVFTPGTNYRPAAPRGKNYRTTLPPGARFRAQVTVCTNKARWHGRC